MSKKIALPRNNNSLYSAMLAIVEPYLTIRDENHHEGVAGKDTGSQRPSTVDSYFQFLIGSQIQNLYRQLYDTNTVGQNSYPSLTERLNLAEYRLDEHTKKYMDGGVLDADAAAGDGRTFNLDYNVRLAQAQYDMVKDMFDDLCDVWNKVTGTKWEYKKPTNTQNDKQMEAAKAGLLSRLKAKHGDTFVKNVVQNPTEKGQEHAAA